MVEKMKNLWKQLLEWVEDARIAIKSSKTMIFNLSIAILGAVEIYSGYLRELVPVSDGAFGLAMVSIAATNAYLRIITTTSLSKKIKEHKRLKQEYEELKKATQQKEKEN